MAQRPAPVVLSLPNISTAVELSPEVARDLAPAASVVLDHVHGVAEPHDARITGEGSHRTGHILRVEVDDRARRSWGDLQDATEKGAEGVAWLVARRVLERIVFRRLPKGDGRGLHDAGSAIDAR